MATQTVFGLACVGDESPLRVGTRRRIRRIRSWRRHPAGLMDFGIMTAKIDEIGYITHAENLGYRNCWVTDSPIIRSNWLGGARARCAGHADDAPRHGRRGPAAAPRPRHRERYRDDQPFGAGPLLPRAPHRAHGPADARAQADEARAVPRVRAGCAGVAARGGSPAHLRRRGAYDPLSDAGAPLPRPRPRDPDLPRRVRPEGPATRG